jgi:hypothetical protein
MVSTRAADLFRRQGGGREHDGQRGEQQRRVAAHEVEMLQMKFGGDGRTCGKRKHKARAHEQQQAKKHEAVYGEPPV